MKIIIETIPHASHRYSTVGDWYTRTEMVESSRIDDTSATSKEVLHIRVSQELADQNPLFAVLVAVHELVEQQLCAHDGVTEQAVDEFDKKFEADREAGLHGETDEPGDASDAPYRVQHGVASGVERLLGALLGVDWNKYDEAVNALP